MIVTKIDCLDCSILDLNKIVTELVGKGVNIRFISENIELKAKESTNIFQSLLFNVLGSFAKFERDFF